MWGHRFKTSPVKAAFANGVAGHVLDYEGSFIVFSIVASVKTL
ncbi:MAG: hypothetical protein HYZ81_05615 [Nitrospinae bacterium]|nr:hypothetical protein [Nitrospinota bacterium]